MPISKFVVAASVGLSVAACATAPNEQSYCEREPFVCVAAGVAVVAGIVIAASNSGGSSGSGMGYSDARLKQDIRPVGMLPNGLHLYAFHYLNDDRTFVGVVAQDVLKDARFRAAVSMDKNGYYVVDYRALGVEIAGSRWQFKRRAGTQWQPPKPAPVSAGFRRLARIDGVLGGPPKRL